MNADLKWLMQVTDAEYRGKSFNGKSLVDTVKGYSLDTVKSTDTFENYSVWAIVLHNMFCKWKVLSFIDPGNPLDFSYEKTDWPSIPGEGSNEDWEKTLEDSDNIHEEYMRQLQKLDPEALDREVNEWKCPLGQAVAWIATHDSYHVAQIRNMGLRV
jgi:hypothetical protein